ncbi:unnamed protein product [Vitrella brassicaformis CCMP3155]|uniref:WW domain-containing protein n=2 Tax=Vitrella brassicaformis TaxID=1169539 RepID=A0A0G4ES98_VITBC|nr:unnamed protein product [Vitrella brassicaformis CCMP3155]|eukprot:CEM00546.1 unnamed protein product [Vitrella brassicaformis CCMP3155]
MGTTSSIPRVGLAYKVPEKRSIRRGSRLSLRSVFRRQSTASVASWPNDPEQGIDSDQPEPQITVEDVDSSDHTAEDLRRSRSTWTTSSPSSRESRRSTDANGTGLSFAYRSHNRVEAFTPTDDDEWGNERRGKMAWRAWRKRRRATIAGSPQTSVQDRDARASLSLAFDDDTVDENSAFPYSTNPSGHVLSQHVYHDEVAAFARSLGVDVSSEMDLLWLIETTLRWPLPPRWTCHADKQGRIFYFFAEAEISTFRHPSELMLRGLLDIARQRRSGRMACLGETLWRAHQTAIQVLHGWSGPFFVHHGGQPVPFWHNRRLGFSSYGDPREDVSFFLTFHFSLLRGIQENVQPRKRRPCFRNSSSLPLSHTLSDHSLKAHLPSILPAALHTPASSITTRPSSGHPTVDRPIEPPSGAGRPKSAPAEDARNGKQEREAALLQAAAASPPLARVVYGQAPPVPSATPVRIWVKPKRPDTDTGSSSTERKKTFRSNWQPSEEMSPRYDDDGGAAIVRAKSLASSFGASSRSTTLSESHTGMNVHVCVEGGDVGERQRRRSKRGKRQKMPP